jgi:hypothetical protein
MWQPWNIIYKGAVKCYIKRTHQICKSHHIYGHVWFMANSSFVCLVGNRSDSCSCRSTNINSSSIPTNLRCNWCLQIKRMCDILNLVKVRNPGTIYQTCPEIFTNYNEPHDNIFRSTHVMRHCRNVPFGKTSIALIWSP